MVTIDPDTGFPEVEDGLRWKVGPAFRLSNITEVTLQKRYMVDGKRTFWQTLMGTEVPQVEEWRDYMSRDLIIYNEHDAKRYGLSKLTKLSRWYNDVCWVYKEVTPDVIRKTAVEILEIRARRIADDVARKVENERLENLYGIYPPKRLDTDTPKRLG